MRRPGETMEGFMLRMIQAEILERAAKVADGNCPRNEPGEYWKGRFDAADKIRALIDADR